MGQEIRTNGGPSESEGGVREKAESESSRSHIFYMCHGGRNGIKLILTRLEFSI